MVMKMTVTKALLLALTVGVACADVDPAQLSGPWRTSAMASDNLEMILKDGPFQMLFREMECNEECNALNVFFYVKKNKVCTPHRVVAQKNADGIYTTDFEGQTSFQFHEVDPVRQIIFINNMGSKGKTSRLSFFVVKLRIVNDDPPEDYARLTEQNGIPRKYIRRVADTDTCPP
uniref:Lipocalin/cytosolic fatty-acid binding domain-containing protein n=1 Tax=Oryctolagus cuniculus TaxID=9986 RepID=U3KNB5_RABIT